MDTFIILDRFSLSGVGTLYTLKGDMNKIKIGSRLFDDANNIFTIKAVEMINYREPEKHFRTDIMNFLLDSENNQCKYAHGNFLFTSQVAMRSTSKMENDESLRIPEGTIILAGDPLPDMTIDEMKKMVSKIESTQELVTVYVAVHNKAWYIEDDVYDYDEGTAEYKQACQMVDAWFDLMEELENKIMKQAADENLLAEKEPNSGTVKQLEKFMQQYGYRDGNGWWIEIDD